jgi:hypothetical protein
MLSTHSRRLAHNGVPWCCIFGYCYPLLKDLEKSSWLQISVSVFCSVCCHTLSSPRLVLSLQAPLQRVDFLCADWSLGFKRSVYTIVGRDLAKRRCQSVLWVIGSWVHCQYLLYDAGMILRSHRRRVSFRLVFLSFPLYEDLGWGDLFWDVLVLFSYITRLVKRAVNPRNGIATYLHQSLLFG